MNLVYNAIFTDNSRASNYTKEADQYVIQKMTPLNTLANCMFSSHRKICDRIRSMRLRERVTDILPTEVLTEEQTDRVFSILLHC